MTTDIINEFIRNSKGPISVALDADQVLARTFDLIVKQINEKIGKSYVLEDMETYPHPNTDILGITNEEFNAMFDELWMKNWKTIEKIADPVLLNDFCSYFKVDVVSSRGEEQSQPLRDWMILNYPNTGLKVVAVPKYSDKTTLPYSVFIDDAPRIAVTIGKQKDKLLILIDAPYNRWIQDASNIIRFSDVNSAFEALLSAQYDYNPDSD